MSKKIIRAAVAAMLGAVITASCAGSAFAAGNEYYLPEVDDMAITLPADMTAVTSSADANDRYFSVFGLDYNTTMNNFKSGNIYLQGMDSSSSVTVTVTMTESDESAAVQNYNLLGSNRLSEVARNFLDNSEYTACTVDSADKSVVWLYFDTSVNSSGSVIRAYQSNTVYNGKSVSVTLQRNTGNVNADDYRTFSDIVASVSFGKVNYFGNLLPFFVIGAGVILILLVILIIAISRSVKRRKKKNDNDRIIEELVGKYSTRSAAVSAGEGSPADETEGTDGDTGYDFSTFDADEGRRYSDEDIDAILGETEGSEDFQSALPVKQEERKTTEDATSGSNDQVSDLFGDSGSAAAPAEAEARETESEEAGEVTGETEAEAEEENETVEAEAETEEAAEAEETETGATEEIKADEAGDGEEKETKAEAEEIKTAEGEPDGEAAEAAAGSGEEADEERSEEEEYFNDEVLVREEVRKNRFKNSSDFFDEIPKGVIGVISSKEIEEAEEYDVIGEVEKKVSEVEKETPTAAETVMNGLRKTGSGVRGFFTHCGYFATNVTREIKRSRDKKKKKKADEERRRRARERAARQKIQTQNGGLVQVRRRGQKRPADRRDKK